MDTVSELKKAYEECEVPEMRYYICQTLKYFLDVKQWCDWWNNDVLSKSIKPEHIRQHRYQ